MSLREQISLVRKPAPLAPPTCGVGGSVALRRLRRDVGSCKVYTVKVLYGALGVRNHASVVADVLLEGAMNEPICSGQPYIECRH